MEGEVGLPGLLLTRKTGETVMIGGENGIPLIEVTVKRANVNRVQLRFLAPREVPIHRKEVWLKIQAGETGGCS